MRVFVTGATGFIGTAVIPELISAGHKVIGLARSDAGAKSLVEAGAQVHRGDLEDLESLRSGAAAADGVIHLAFNHDFSKYMDNCQADKRAIEALGSVLVGSDRPLVVTSGTAVAFQPGRVSTEDDPPVPSSMIPRSASEEAATEMVSRGVRATAMRLPQVHNRLKQGLITPLIEIARAKGVSAYVGDGRNRWPAAHLLDTARLYRLALEKGIAGERFNAVAEEGVPLREIAEAVGRRINVPVVSKTTEEAPEHFGWLAFFVGNDAPASSAKTQERLGWHPTQKGLISDLDPARYFEA